MPGGRRSWTILHLGKQTGAPEPAPPPGDEGRDQSPNLPMETRASMLRCEPWTGYLAPPGFLGELLDEVRHRGLCPAGSPDSAPVVLGDLVLLPGEDRNLAWAQNTWPGLRLVQVASIRDAAESLKKLGRLWVKYPLACHRRSTLIQDQLRSVPSKPWPFPRDGAFPPLGSWAMVDQETLLASPACTSPFAHGLARFAEDHLAPPSRAYLKLWEFFTRMGVRPGPGELCLDLGASPGGWTWVLQGLSGRVLAVDKAALAPEIAALPGVATRHESAFGLEPRSVGEVDWLFSDIICYPERLLGLIRRWLDSGLARNYVCSVKFQGATDWEVVDQLEQIPGSGIIHLSVNRHELTWYRLQPRAAIKSEG